MGVTTHFKNSGGGCASSSAAAGTRGESPANHFGAMTMRYFFVLFMISASPALADSNVTMVLSPAEVVALVRAMDKWPTSEPAPDGYWIVQGKLVRAVNDNPEASTAFEKLWRKKHGR